MLVRRDVGWRRRRRRRRRGLYLRIETRKRVELEKLQKSPWPTRSLCMGSSAAFGTLCLKSAFCKPPEFELHGMTLHGGHACQVKILTMPPEGLVEGIARVSSLRSVTFGQPLSPPPSAAADFKGYVHRSRHVRFLNLWRGDPPISRAEVLRRHATSLASF